MEGYQYNTCPIHGKKCSIVCLTCRRLICDVCKNHEKHKIEWTSNYLKKHESDILNRECLLELEPQIERNIASVDNQMNSIIEEMDLLHNRMKQCLRVKEKPKESLKEDIGLLNKLKKMVSSVKEKANTPALIDTCNSIKAQLEVEDKIIQEIEMVSGLINAIEMKQRRLKTSISYLKVKRKQLELVQGTVHGSYNNDSKLALFILREAGDLDFNILTGIPEALKYNINTWISKFCAFSSIGAAFDIREVMNQKLIDAGNGIRMSVPLTVKKGLETQGTILQASVSHQGIVAICSNYWGYKLQFTKLFTGEQVEMKIENNSTVCFYDDKAVVLTWEKHLRGTSIYGIFNNPSKEVLRDYTDIDVSHNTDVSIVHNTRTLYYLTPHDRKLYKFNVDNKENILIKLPIEVWALASMTGISTSVNAIFQDANDNTYVLNEDMSTTLISNKKEDGNLRAVLPSALQCTEFDYSAFKYCNYFIYQGKALKLHKIGVVEHSCTIIRVLRDIFLAFDNSKATWVLERIVVP